MSIIFDGFHGYIWSANAWEEGDEVVLITCRLQNPDLDQVNGPAKDHLENFTNELYVSVSYWKILSWSHYFSILNTVLNVRYEMRFNMKNGAASQKRLSMSAVDFPRINENYTGRYFFSPFLTILSCIFNFELLSKVWWCSCDGSTHTGTTSLGILCIPKLR